MHSLISKMYKSRCALDEGVVYRAHALHRANRLRAVEDAAQRAGKLILRDAQRQAHQHTTSARATGYRDGLIFCLNELVGQLSCVAEQAAAQRRADLEGINRQLVMLFSDERTINALISDYLRDAAADADTCITISLPRWATLSVSDLTKRLAAQYPDITVMRSDSDALALCSRSLSITFDPRLAADKAMTIANDEHQHAPASTLPKVALEALSEHIHLLLEGI